MATMTERLADEPVLAAQYSAAHVTYLADRAALGQELGLTVPEIDGQSAGGMPDRVKCLHALAAHALAKGPGVNPLGDETLAAVGQFWAAPCLP